jgi:predicted GH43/DUF377 family glycosyl hydrolase
MNMLQKHLNNVKIRPVNLPHLGELEYTEELPNTCHPSVIRNDFPRSLCNYEDLIVLDSSKLIDYGQNVYFYNSCICNYKDGYRLFYRCGKDPKTAGDRIATCLLTKDLQVVPYSNKYLNLYSNFKASKQTGPDNSNRNIKYAYVENGKVVYKHFIYKDGEHVEDPRVVQFNDAWFIFYTDGISIGVAKLDLETCDVIYSHFMNSPPEYIRRMKDSDGREKNWIPFVSNNQLYLLYSESPRTYILCSDDKIRLSVQKYDKMIYSVNYDYGTIRGGCPPIAFNNKTLIWFFHSTRRSNTVIGDGRTIYMISAYLSSNVYPFEVSKILIAPLLIGIPSPVDTQILLQDNVVYPCGAVVIDDDTFLISMGINDYKIGHLYVKKTDLHWKNADKMMISYSVL